MTSNCYIVWDDVTMDALVIDPASEHSLREIEYLTRLGLRLDYILLTHEHTDHTWGVNALLDKYDAKVTDKTKRRKHTILFIRYPTFLLILQYILTEFSH